MTRWKSEDDEDWGKLVKTNRFDQRKRKFCEFIMREIESRRRKKLRGSWRWGRKARTLSTMSTMREKRENQGW